MSEVTKSLDLDELFGQARAVKVKWQGKEYELVRLEALGPREIVQFQGLHAKANHLQNVSMSKEISQEQADEIVVLFDEMLLMLCKEFPIDTMPFAAKTRSLEFYILETEGKKKMDQGLKALQKKQTGAMRSRS